MDRKHVIELISEVLQENTDDQRLKEFDVWYNQSPSNQLFFEKMKNHWNESQNLSVFDQFDNEQGLKKLNNQIDRYEIKRSKRSIWFSVISTAAACIILFFGIRYFDSVHLESQMITFKTAYGEKASVKLPDGSSVKLNSGSQLSYNMAFGKKDRLVRLTGEAFFDIAKDKTPFVVSALRDVKVEVLGTRFNISAYADETKIKTVLEEGDIWLTTPSFNDDVHKLTPGQMASYNSIDHTVKVSPVRTKLHTSWVGNKFYFQDESLRYLTKRIEKIYNVEIECNDAQLLDSFHYTAVFENETIDEILEALAATGKIDFIRNGRNIKITNHK